MNDPAHLPSALREPLPSALLDALRTLLGDRLSTTDAMREHHGKDESAHPHAWPDAVAFVQTADEVAHVVKLCRQYRAPLIAYGAGSSIEGQVLAIHGGLSIDFTRMNRILAVNVDDLDVTVEPGVTRKQLNSHLSGTGIFFPIDPGADATIGGMAATRASGTNAVRYGTMRENVMGCCSANSTARPPALPSRRAPCRRSRRNWAAWISNGRPDRKTARACGRRATMPTLRAGNCGPATARFPPILAPSFPLFIPTG